MAVYEAFGTGVPCPPWAYDAIVAPGPDWDAAGHAFQNVVTDGQGQKKEVLGRLVYPTASDLQEWSNYIVMALEVGWCPFGGWAPYWATPPSATR